MAEPKSEVPEDTDHLIMVDEEFPARLKTLRWDKLGLSQRELAIPGASYAYISRLEAGTREPSSKVLRGLAKKLGVTEAYLAFGDETRVLSLDEALVLARFGDLSDSEFEILTDVMDALRYGDASELTDVEELADSKLEIVEELRANLDEFRESSRLHSEVAGTVRDTLERLTAKS